MPETETATTTKNIMRMAARALRMIKLFLARQTGLEFTMAKIIEFYIPKKFQETRKWGPGPGLKRGKVIQFRPPIGKSA